MKSNYDKCLKTILHHEGGYVNHPKDPGGETNLGVTKRVYQEHGGTKDMKDLLVEDVAPIYKKGYWDRMKGDDLPSGVDWACFDWAVNSGSKRPSKALQRSVGAKADGAIGPQTLGMVEAKDPKEVVKDMHNQRQAFYERLKTFKTFGKGWTRRNKETLETALEMM